MHIQNPKDTYNATHPLKLSNPDMDKIEARRNESLRVDIVEFLKVELPEESADYSDKKLYKMVQHCEVVAEELGLESRESLMRWAYLTLLTRGENLKHAGVRDYILYNGIADRAVAELVKRAAKMKPVRLSEIIS